MFTVMACQLAVMAQGTLRYWFDRSETIATATVTEGEQPLLLDASPLDATLHSVTVQVGDKDGTWSVPVSAWFSRTPSVAAMTQYTWFDQDTQLTSHAGGSLRDAIDISALADGFHTLNYVAVTGNIVSAPRSAMFLKAPWISEESLHRLKCYALVDRMEASQYPCTIVNGAAHIELDVATLAEGLHSVMVIMADPESGVVSQARSAYFLKLPMGGNGIKRYTYWVNDDHDNAVTVELETPQTPYSLVSLLEIGSYTLRSSSFDLAIEQGNPVVYARNDFNILFVDAASRMSGNSTPFTDTRVSQKPENVRQLVSGKREKIGTIGENEIRWYRLDATIGDSLVLAASSACTVDLFSPTGKRLMSRSGIDATTAAGIHTREEGVHYVAVHDPRWNNSIELDYTLIDRYAVLEHTPASSARGDMVSVQLTGNGFEHLKGLQLVAADGTVIPGTLSVEDHATAAGLFNLSALPDMEQTLAMNLLFDDGEEQETLTVKNGLTVLGENKGEVTVEVIPSMRIGTPYEVTIRFKNTGNVPFWGIPFNLALPRTPPGCKLQFRNFLPYVKWDEREKYPMPYFTPNLLDTGDYGFLFPMILPYIGAYEEINLTIGLISPPHHTIRLYAWAGEPWSEEFKRLSSPDHSLEEYRKPQSNFLTAAKLCLWNAIEKDPTLEDWLTGNEERPDKSLKWERLHRMGNLAETNATLAEQTGRTMGGIINGARLQNLEAYGIDLSDETYSSLAAYQNDLKKNMPHPASIAAEALNMGDAYALAEGYMQNCASSSNPKPEPTDVECLQDGDPNDIAGYKAESGSEYIGLDVEKLSYSIEFENSPEIANAPAHNIVVTDRLDPKIFDLSTFHATMVTFADKELMLDSEGSYAGTVDMRPAVNAIAEVKMSLDRKTGEVTWSIDALDPLTLAPTDHYMQGILPVNNDGNGTGTVNFEIALRHGLQDGVTVDNSASIVFGRNEAIETPTWHNVTDYVRPVSYVADMVAVSENEIEMQFASVDEGSGLWYYDLYCRIGEDGEWFPIATRLDGTPYRMEVEDGVMYSFCTVATDRAGNREQKELAPEYSYQDNRILSGITEISADTPLRRSDKLYDLLGRRVKGTPSPGIYLLKGKKIIIR